MNKEFLYLTYVNAILFFIVYYLNHKDNFLKKLPFLFIGTCLIFLIFYLIFKKFDFSLFCGSLAIYSGLDNAIYLSKNRNKEVNK